MKTAKRRVLLVSYFFPPRPSVGSLRSQYLAHYLPAEGWNTTILTADLQGASPPAWSDVIETPYTDVVNQTKRLFRLSPSQSTYRTFGVGVPKTAAQSKLKLRQWLVFQSYKLLTYPDPARGWYRYAAARLSSLLAQDRFDAVISTSPPVTAHFIVAKSLNRRLPWIADLRDLWTDNPYYPGIIRRMIDSLLEGQVLSTASAITTISKPLAGIIARRHPRTPVFDIPNAFDPSEWENIPFVNPDKCTLTYAGHMRDPRVLFEAIAKEVRAGSIDPKSFELNLYTGDLPWLRSEIEQFGLNSVVTVKGVVARSEVLVAERSSSANVILMSYLPGEEAGYPAKVFEYFGAGRPIFGIGPPHSAVGELLGRAGGFYAATVDEARAILRKIYQAYVDNRGQLLNSEVTQSYSTSVLARKFAEVLNSITAQS